MTYYKGEKKEAEAIAWGKRIKTKPSFWQKAKGYGKIAYSETKGVAKGFKKNIPGAYKRTKKDIFLSGKTKRRWQSKYKFKGYRYIPRKVKGKWVITKVPIVKKVRSKRTFKPRRKFNNDFGIMGNFEAPRFDFNFGI